MSINITMLAPGFVGNTFYNTGATADVSEADAVAAVSSQVARYTTPPLLSQASATEALLEAFKGLSSSKKEEFRSALDITASGGTGTAVVETREQTGHGLTVGKAVTKDASGGFVLAVTNDTLADAAAVGIVSAVADANNLTVTLAGRVTTGLSGLTFPAIYYVKDDGTLTLDTNDATNWVVPILVADSATSGYVLPQTPQSKALIPISAIDGLSSTSLVDFGGQKIKTITKSGNYTLGTDSANEAYGYIVYVTAAATITLPAIAVGMSVTVIVVGAVAVSVKPNASDKIVLDGTTLDDGDKATSTSTTGDIAVFTYYSADGWYASTNGWTDGGA